MNAVADGTKDASGELDSFSDFCEIDIGELPDGLVGVRLDEDWYFDGALELIELGCILRLGKGELVTSDPINDEAMLSEDILGFSSFAKVVVTKVDATSVDRHAAGEALVLGRCQHVSR